MNKRTSLILGALLLLISGAVLADNVLKQKVRWSPETLNLPSLKPGESTTTSVVLTNGSLLANQKINGEHLAFQITNPNGATIVATAKFPKKFEPGQKVTVTLVVAVASDTPALPPRVITGKVQLLKNENEIKIFEKPLLVNITIAPFLLPPEPDKATDEATIEGVDSNGNGVPDRVDRFIAFAAPESEKKRVAMTLSAKAQQDFFIDYLEHLGEDPNDAGVVARVLAVDEVRGKVENCRRYIYGDYYPLPNAQEAMDINHRNSREIEALFMDTPERLRAFQESERPLVATSYPHVEPEQYKQQCLDLGFDPDVLPN